MWDLNEIDLPWKCLCGQFNEYRRTICKACDVGIRGMKRSEWEKERKRLEDTKQREIDLINDLRYKVKDLPEECEERENIAKPFLYRSGGLPLNIELAIFPHRVKKREQEALREKRIKEEAEKEVLEIIREERRKESVSFWFVVVVVVLFFVWRCA